MRIGNINSFNSNQNFGGWFSRKKNNIEEKPIQAETNTAQKNIEKLLDDPEERLKKRLVNYETLMIDFYTGDIKDMNTGKLFTGKYVVPAQKLEHIYHVKNGKTVGSLVRMVTGQKQWAQRGEYDKEYNFTLNNILSNEEAKNETIKMIEADDFAEERMRHNFVIKMAMESPDGTVYLTK